MKRTIAAYFLVALISTLLAACGGGGGGASDPAATASVYAGSYTGTFSGADSGTWTITVDTSGKISGTAISSDNDNNTITGQVNCSGTFTASSSTASWGGSATGSVNRETGTLTGTWITSNPPGLSITLTGNRTSQPPVPSTANKVTANGATYNLTSTFRSTSMTTLYLDFPYKGDTLRIEAWVINPKPGLYDSLKDSGTFGVGYRYRNSGNISLTVAGTMNLTTITNCKISGTFSLVGIEPGTSTPLTCEGSFDATNQDQSAQVTPTAGKWTGDKMQFNVATDGGEITGTGSLLEYEASIIIDIPVTGCGAIGVTHYIYDDVTITNGNFSYSDSDTQISGTIASATTASGNYTYSHRDNVNSCTMTGSGSWTASK